MRCRSAQEPCTSLPKVAGFLSALATLRWACWTAIAGAWLDRRLQKLVLRKTSKHLQLVGWLEAPGLQPSVRTVLLQIGVAAQFLCDPFGSCLLWYSLPCARSLRVSNETSSFASSQGCGAPHESSPRTLQKSLGGGSQPRYAKRAPLHPQRARLSAGSLIHLILSWAARS